MLKEKDFTNASFEKSSTTREDAPPFRLPEIAFAGRSNVGKSSLLNSIFNRKNLVKTSSTPGKTQLINYFNICDKIYCVDLPGYGFAKIPKSHKAKWQKMIETYFLENNNLRKVYLLIDSRHDHMDIDKEMIGWLNHLGLNYSIVLSKTDKVKKSELQKRIKYYTNEYPHLYCIPFSIKDGKSIKKIKFQIIRDITDK